MMQAVWLRESRLELRDIPRPTVPEGEALLRITRAGICNTDIELIRGYYPYDGIPGHEFVAVVEDGPGDLVGARVVGEINAVCHRCPECRAGLPTHCRDRTVFGIVNRHGAFAEFATLPAENLHVVPEGVSDDAATFVEPLAAALEILEQVRLAPDDSVLVVGDGKLGQMIVRVLLLNGNGVFVTGHHPDKLQLLEQVGATGVAADAVQTRSFDLVVECTGNAEGFGVARRAVRPRGTIVLKSTYAGELTFDASALVVDEVQLVGSRCGPFRPAIRLLEHGVIDVESLVHARYPLAGALEAFDHAQRPGVLKVLLEMD